MKIELNATELLIGIHGCASFPRTSPGLWKRLVDSFNNMSAEERIELFHRSVIDLLTDCWHLFNGPTRDGEPRYGSDDFNMFISRFNPYNQYSVEVSNNDSTDEYECFWFNGKFYKDSNSVIDDKHIKHVKWCGKEDSDLYENKYGQARSKIDERVGLKPPYEV